MKSTDASPRIAVGELWWHVLHGKLESLAAEPESSGHSVTEEFALFAHP